MSDKVFVGNSLQEMDIGQTSLPISKVILNVDSEVYYIAGDDSGKTIEADCPWATQEMANNILSKMRGFVYKPFDGTNAFIDPAAELGDGVTVGGTYSILASMGKTFDHQSVANIGAPGTDEIEDEYPYKTKQRKNTDRVLAKTRSLISKTAEEIRLEVQGVDERVSAIDVSLDAITLTVAGLNRDMSSIELRADSIEASVKTAQGDISALSIRAGNIEASVSSVQTGLSQTVRIASDGVTITNAAGSKLTIDGGQIDAENLNLTGRIAFGDLTSAVQNDIDEAWEMAYDAQDTAYDAADTVDAWRYDGGTYIDSSKIMVTTLMATELLGGEVALLTAAERQAGGLDITGSSSSTYAIELWSNGALRLVADDGDLYMEAGGEYLTIGYVQGEGYAVVVSNTLMPSGDGTINLGNYTYYWKDAYIEQCYGSAEAASTSDRNKKNSISYDLDRYDPFFDGLLPCIFKLNNGTSGRYHPGLIAQDVEQTLAECGISTTDFAGFIKMEDSYALRYGEFIALLIWQVQKLKARVKELEVKL